MLDRCALKDLTSSRTGHSRSSFFLESSGVFSFQAGCDLGPQSQGRLAPDSLGRTSRALRAAEAWHLQTLSERLVMFSSAAGSDTSPTVL